MMSKKYTKTLWHHQNDDDPIIYYSQFDECDEEVRRIEVYHGGQMRYGDRHTQSPDDDVWIYGISYQEVMSTQTDELVNTDISPSEFEQLWSSPDNPLFCGKILPNS